MNSIFTRTLQKQGTSVVVPIPTGFRKFGFNVGIKVEMWEEGGNIIISTRDEENEKLCPHCNGLRTCRCADCALTSGATIIRRPVVIAVDCQYCHGKGLINKKQRR